MQEAVQLPVNDDELLALTGIEDPPPLEEGLFRANGWMRRISGEPALLLGGGRALLLEVAHPLVAQGVADHSNFRTDPFGRLQRTLDAMSAIAFKDRASAFAAARRIESSHQRVRGSLRESAGRFEAGHPYCGRDPELVRWVWATLADTSIAVYERFVGPVEPDARDEFYRDQCVLARLVGTPAELVPPSWGDFADYMRGMLEGDELGVTSEAREIAEAVLDPPPGLASRRQIRAITTTLAPARIRDAFGLALDDDARSTVDALAASVRALRPATS